MATVPKEYPAAPKAQLHSGDRMAQEEFHRIYEQMPEDFRAELIGGIVYVTSPLKRPHGKHHIHLGSVFAAYEGNTPGVDAGDNVTVILGDDDEPQPDLYLRILPVCGGQSRETKDEYIEGAPELLAEIAHNSRAIDLHDKRTRYREAGVLEQIVVCLEPREVRWFDLPGGQEFSPDADGILKSVAFPGLWLQGEALLQLDYRKLMTVSNRGLATAAHAALVTRLADARQKQDRGPQGGS